MHEKSKYARDNLDYLRTLLVHEPRGHSKMYAALLVPPTIEEADVGVIYPEPGGYVTMCGHGTIAICTISDHQQRWPRPLPGAILIPPALLVVADCHIGIQKLSLTEPAT
jgi:proline racemase